MTKEHMTIVGIDDISAVQVDCSGCSGGIRIRLNGSASPNIPGNCPTCGQYWKGREESKELKLVECIDVIRSSSDNSPMKIRFEIND